MDINAQYVVFGLLLVCSSRWQVDTSRDVTSSWQPAATGICWCQKPFLEQPAAEELLDLAETWSWIWSKTILHVGFISQSDSWWQLYLWGRKQHKSHANWSQVKRGREDETVLVVRSVTCARFCMTCYFARKKSATIVYRIESWSQRKIRPTSKDKAAISLLPQLLKDSQTEAHCFQGLLTSPLSMFELCK